MNKTTFDELKSVFNFSVEGKSNKQLDEYAYSAYLSSCSISIKDPDYNKIIKNLQDIVFKYGDPQIICKLCKLTLPTNLNRVNSLFEAAILELGGDKYILKFAKYVKGANIVDLEKAIIKLNDVRCIYILAKYVKGADIELLQSAIIKSRNAHYMYLFARHVKGANITDLEEAIVKTKQIEIVRNFFKDIPGSNIERVSDKLIEKYSLQEFKSENKAYASKEVRKMMSDAKKNIR